MTKVLRFEELKKIIDSEEKKLEFIKYFNQFKNSTIVVKYGSSALETSQKISYLVDDLIFLKRQNIHVVLIHGGSRQLNEKLKEKGIQVELEDGIRITSKEVLKNAISVFKEMNTYIVNEINKYGNGEVKAIGINGSDIPITISEFLNKDKYGYVGLIQQVDTSFLNALDETYIPVISSLSRTAEGESLNINADTNSTEIAKTLNAEKLVFMTDTDGILDNEGQLNSSLDYDIVKEMIKNGAISGGMIPKAKACLTAIHGNVKKVHIISGTDPHALVKEILTDEGIGTEVCLKEKIY